MFYSHSKFKSIQVKCKYLSLISKIVLYIYLKKKYMCFIMYFKEIACFTVWGLKYYYYWVIWQNWIPTVHEKNTFLSDKRIAVYTNTNTCSFKQFLEFYYSIWGMRICIWIRNNTLSHIRILWRWLLRKIKHPDAVELR